MTYQAPVRDYTFLFREVLRLDRYSNLPAFADAQPDTLDQVLEEAGTDKRLVCALERLPPAWEGRTFRGSEGTGGLPVQ